MKINTLSKLKKIKVEVKENKYFGQFYCSIGLVVFFFWNKLCSVYLYFLYRCFFFSRLLLFTFYKYTYSSEILMTHFFNGVYL